MYQFKGRYFCMREKGKKTITQMKNNYYSYYYYQYYYYYQKNIYKKAKKQTVKIVRVFNLSQQKICQLVVFDFFSRMCDGGQIEKGGPVGRTKKGTIKFDWVGFFDI
eukprot:TRINITY_DN46142_c0_g1_i1.p3 TRINITY_DN46142_c0_g1~~TRINITY_DN46142_c0_g1_i1.p3  ORF type:complete len:107 (-),score=9.68 TRINITY_DN46142_c0_g1_i1:83-403(-)